MATGWNLVHDESLRADRTLTIWRNEGRDRTLFEMNREGLYISYYFTAQDAINNDNKTADICYGWDLVMSEGDDAVRGAWMNRVADNIGADTLSCEHTGFTCEEMFHAAQVILGNDDEDNCAVCEAVNS
jgi:hypothetical protein